ncbi:6-carboxytetrahydropterin synthase [Methanobacterium sp. ACI-7]|uniref:6-carboxytetrahydropterin synthase n=1 Tax=unclassified Methanobacterium TaxID=2627676 RepID=UPI0039C30B69
MKIVINGIHANLRFSSAHMIPLHESCGGIHGHSYIVDVEFEGERSGEFGFVVDFKKAKGIVREICSELDHKVLLPSESNVIQFKTQDKKSIEFQIGEKDYKLPLEDCCLLPLKSTSAEDLAEYFTEEIFKYLEETNNNISCVQICVNEGIGQGAYFQKHAKK